METASPREETLRILEALAEELEHWSSSYDVQPFERRADIEMARVIRGVVARMRSGLRPWWE